MENSHQKIISIFYKPNFIKKLRIFKLMKVKEKRRVAKYAKSLFQITNILDNRIINIELLGKYFYEKSDVEQNLI